MQAVDVFYFFNLGKKVFSNCGTGKIMVITGINTNKENKIETNKELPYNSFD